ncbi:MAG: twin-arginine translocation signal domain-containing protein [Anaerolineae bacterium]|nr:twin-arginine translocation signal domain-containing protein [Gemmatimonadaceae bacterium]
MANSRRTFLKTSAATVGALGMTGMVDLAGAKEVLAFAKPNLFRAPKPLRILILGGTGFTGPHQVRYAVGRGHRVTVFNRGRRQADLPKEVEHLIGDRNGQLDALKGRDWDVVIDNPTTLPKWVRDSGQILKGKTGQYVFISTISVYSDNSKAGMDESAALAKYEGTGDPLAITQGSGELYGPLKVLSEREAEKWFPGKTTIIRPGLIVGPGDETDRFTYWPVRVDRGGEVMAPGQPGDPVQFIDARDLAEWTIRMVEQGDVGTYNATGPRSPLSIAEMLYGIRAVTSGSSVIGFTWVDAPFLEQQKVQPWSDMPVWIPPQPDTGGWARVSIDRALAKGLTFRPLAETVKATLDWHKTRPADRQAKLRAGLSPEREAEVLSAWKARARK